MKTFSRYKALKDGSIVSSITGTIMKQFRDKDGYWRVTLSSDCHKKKQVISSRFIWSFFNGNIPKGKVIAHIDGNNDNNNLGNLKCCTVLENNRDKEKHGTQCKGESHGVSKLSEANVLSIVKDNRTYRTIAKEYGVTFGLIGHIKKDKIWKHLQK